MKDKFPQSKQLKKLIESHGWSLYDTTLSRGRKTAFSWKELQEAGVAEEFVTWHNYIFAPLPQKGENLEQAYSHTNGLGPCMQLNNIEEHINMDGERVHIVDGKITYIFSRLGVEPYRSRDTIGLYTPLDAKPDMPALLIPFEYVLEKFQKYFRIITPEEYYGGLQHPNIRAKIN